MAGTSDAPTPQALLRLQGSGKHPAVRPVYEAYADALDRLTEIRKLAVAGHAPTFALDQIWKVAADTIDAAKEVA